MRDKRETNGATQIARGRRLHWPCLRKSIGALVLMLGLTQHQALAQSYIETFEGTLANPTGANSVALQNYSGAAAPYTASAWWRNYGQCNGVVVRYNTPAFQSGHCDASSTDSNGSARNNVRRLADVLGQIGESAGPLATDSNSQSSPTNRSNDSTRNNHALTAWTIDTGSNDYNNQLQFQTGNIPGLSTTESRYYTARVDVAEASCSWAGGANNSRLYFSLVSGANESFMNTTANPIRVCTDPTARYYTSPTGLNNTGATVSSNPPWSSGGSAVRAGRFYSNGALKVLAGGTGLQVRMYNMSGESDGNDAAVDNISLVDVTPRLSKAFAPSMVAPGETATITFTIANTPENLIKAGWQFTDQMNPNLSLASAVAGGTCVNYAGSPGTVAQLQRPTGEASAVGDTTFTVRGTLPAQSSCTVTVQVRLAASATIPQVPNCGSHIVAPTDFVLPPDPSTCAVLNVGRYISFEKQWQYATPGDTVALNVGGPVVLNPVAGAAVAPNAGTPARTLVQIGNSAELSETFSVGSQSDYVASFACSRDDLGTSIAVTASGLSATFDVPSDGDVSCIVTNTFLPPRIVLRKTTLGVPGGEFVFSVSPSSSGSGVVSTAVAGTPTQVDGDPSVSGVQPFVVPLTSLGADVVISELSLPMGWKLDAASCRNRAGALVGGLSGASYTLPGASVVASEAFECDFTNIRMLVDLSVSKSNGATTVGSGMPTTYVITVTNHGPDAVSGALVSDMPNGELICANNDTVVCAGAGCPAGPLTIGQLTAGIELGNLTAVAPNNSVTLSLTCQVR